MRSQRLVGLLTLVALVAIVIGISGVQLSLPSFGRADPERPPLPGVRVVAASVLLRVGVGAPAPGELAYLAVERPGANLVVSDAQRTSVLRFDPSGHLLSEWGPQLGNTVLAEPAGVAVQGDNFYVLDRGMPRMFRLDATGRLQSMFSLESLGTYGLNGMAVDRAGTLYAADTGRNRILVLGPDGALLRSIGRGGTDLGGLTQPMALAFAPDGGLFVADWENSRIAHWDAQFSPVEGWTTGFRPFGVAVDQFGRVFVPDSEHRRVVAYSPQGAVLGDLGGAGSPPIDIAPKQVAVARADPLALYVLASDGIERLDLENTAPPPQGGPDVDVVSLVVIVVLIALAGLAIVSRRARRQAGLAGPALGRPVGLDAENGAEGQHQQAQADQHLLIADQSEREH